MAESTKKTSMDAYTQFEQWLGEQPYWLQDAAYRIYHGQPIDQEQIEAYMAMCIAQAKKEKVDYKRLPKNGSRSQTVSSIMSVLNLSGIVGVNALAPDASLDFSPTGVTVIYGLNGAGKSGFMRVFKQLSGSPYEEVIQPNVFKKDAGEKPSCRFTISEDGQDRDISCSLAAKSKSTPLVNCDVFDTRISNEYITKTNNVSYQPFVFTVLAELSKVADRVSKYIGTQIEAVPSTAVNIPSEFQAREDIVWIQQLGATSSFPDKYSNWSGEQGLLLEELPKKLDVDKVKSEFDLCSNRFTTVSAILDDLTTAKAFIDSPKLSCIYEKFKETQRKLDAAKEFFTEQADAQDQLSVSSADWKELWSVARRYYEEKLCVEGGAHFGEEGSICPLCHQIITGKAVERFKSVNEYVNGTCSDDHKKSTASLRKYLKDVSMRAYSVVQIETQLASIFAAADLMTIKSAYTAFDDDKEIADVESEYQKIMSINISDAIDVLKKEADSLKAKYNELKNALEDKGKAQLQQQYTDLKFHKWVYDNKLTIETAIANLKKKQELNAAKAFLTTNKITTESNLLADTLITEAYIARFNAEIKRLAPKLQVKLEKAASQKGSTPYKVLIDTDSGIKCKPEDILSEGEQRIVALSAFFADATGRNINTPIIIDDPISSLDLNYESAATRRIVELARNRQVIVFTHRISMLTGIEETCQRLGVQHKENYIRSTAKGKGVPDLADIYRGDVKKHLTGMLGRIREIKAMDPDSLVYSDAIGKQCQQFRICVERSVEDILLNGIVHRFERRIMTNGKVNKLTKITDKDCSFVDDMMTKYSFTEHSQPIDSPPVEITIEELSKDISAYIAWITEYRKRMQ